MNFNTWLCFGLGILIVFTLWWIFFALIADRKNKRGMMEGIITGALYIPALASLGMVGASFPSLFETSHEGHVRLLQVIFGTSVATFLFSITAISYFLIYPKEYEPGKRSMQVLIASAGLINLLFIPLYSFFTVVPYLCCVFFSLLIIVVLITRSWFRIELNKHE